MQYQEPNEFLEIVNLNRALDLDVERGLNEFAWEEFKEMLMTHRIRPNKDGPSFMPVLMKPEAEWQPLHTEKNVMHYRGDVNVEAITVLVIDLDKPGALAQAEQIFSGYEYVVHSTHNFTPETPWKYRMAIRLAEPIPVDNWPVCFEALETRIDLDPSCKNPSRFYYYPSHSTESNIPPQAFHKRGRALNLDDILLLAGDKVTEIRERHAHIKVADPSRPRTKRHFSGRKVNLYDGVDHKVDFSQQGFEERHTKSLHEYSIEGSNHNLARDITSREMTVLGPKADMKSLLLFMFQHAAKEGRALETGNTPDEIPGMIVTAMRKYAPEAYVASMTEHDGAVAEWLQSLTRWASLNYKSAELPQKKIIAEAHEQGPGYYPVMRERHKRFLHEYVSEGDVRVLLKQVMSLELRSEKPRYSDIAKAMITYQLGYLTKVKRKPETEAVKKMADDLPALTRLFTEKHIEAEPKKLAFAKSALLIEFSQRFPSKEKTKASEVSLSPT